MAFNEVTAMIQGLRDNGIAVHVFEDQTRLTPDSVFPNNWLVTMPAGELVSFPMYPENRRAERRADILDLLAQQYRVTKQVDYSDFEMERVFLEGTGSMVLDHNSKIAYAALSNRTHPTLLQHFCETYGYEAAAFDATDDEGIPIYHTNVMMSVAEKYAVIAAEQIRDTAQRKRVLEKLKSTGKEVVEISEQQVNHFCGNVLQLQNTQGESLLAMSKTAFEHFTEAQKATLSNYVQLLPFAVPTIELAGGSVRCMLAGVHLHQN